VALAALQLEQGAPGPAETWLRQAAEQFGRERARDSETQALVVLARLLVSQGELAAARQAVARARSLGEGSQNPRVPIRIDLVSARLHGSGGQGALARELLAGSLARSRAGRFLGLELEARLLLGQIEVKSGETAAGRARLEALEREAADQGFGLIARQAAAARRRPPE
jgi:ATP/maltotriose-dependent transcriptional regulator MalT